MCHLAASTISGVAPSPIMSEPPLLHVVAPLEATSLHLLFRAPASGLRSTAAHLGPALWALLHWVKKRWKSKLRVSREAPGARSFAMEP